MTMEDYPEAGMSALKYYTIQSYTKWCVTPPLSMPPQAFAAANRPRYLPAAPRWFSSSHLFCVSLLPTLQSVTASRERDAHPCQPLRRAASRPYP